MQIASRGRHVTASPPLTVDPVLSDSERTLLGAVARRETQAIGRLVDRWASAVYVVTDALRLGRGECDEVAEETLRRMTFDAPRFVLRPEKFFGWLQRTVNECAGAVVARRRMSFDEARSRPSRAPTSGNALELSRILESGDLPAALAFVNSLTPYRFTGVYQFNGLTLHNLHLYDRTAGYAEQGPVAKLSDTYCLWIHETLSVVQMSDSLMDPRATNHPKRSVVRSYCGGPIRDSQGDLCGTLCHFDYEARETPQDVLLMLEEIVPAFSKIVSE